MSFRQTPRTSARTLSLTIPQRLVTREYQNCLIRELSYSIAWNLVWPSGLERPSSICVQHAKPAWPLFAYLWIVTNLSLVGTYKTSNRQTYVCLLFNLKSISKIGRGMMQQIAPALVTQDVFLSCSLRWLPYYRFWGHESIQSYTGRRSKRPNNWGKEVQTTVDIPVGALLTAGTPPGRKH